MKVISKFKDYYDSVSHQYLDKEILYLRETRIMEISRKTADTLPAVHYDGYVRYENLRLQRDFLVNASIIGFCGKLYPFVSVKVMSTEQTHYLYDIESFQQFAKEYGMKLKEERGRWRWRSYDFCYMSDYVRFFNNIEKYENLSKFFVDYQVPCFKYSMVSGRTYKLTLNPPLKPYGFMKVKDPFSAHQELYQFVSGYLNQPTQPMVQISDKDKIHKHGFDKWSFRQKGPKK